MEEFLSRILSLPNVKLFFDYWYIWIFLAILLVITKEYIDRNWLQNQI